MASACGSIHASGCCSIGTHSPPASMAHDTFLAVAPLRRICHQQGWLIIHININYTQSGCRPNTKDADSRAVDDPVCNAIPLDDTTTCQKHNNRCGRAGDSRRRHRIAPDDWAICTGVQPRVAHTNSLGFHKLQGQPGNLHDQGLYGSTIITKQIDFYHALGPIPGTGNKPVTGHHRPSMLHPVNNIVVDLQQPRGSQCTHVQFYEYLPLFVFSTSLVLTRILSTLMELLHLSQTRSRYKIVYDAGLRTGSHIFVQIAKTMIQLGVRVAGGPLPAVENRNTAMQFLCCNPCPHHWSQSHQRRSGAINRTRTIGASRTNGTLLCFNLCPDREGSHTNDALAH